MVWVFRVWWFVLDVRVLVVLWWVLLDCGLDWFVWVGVFSGLVVCDFGFTLCLVALNLTIWGNFGFRWLVG